MRIFDSHCHLYDETHPDRTIYEAVEGGVTGFVAVGTSYETSKLTVDIVNSLSDKFPEIDLYCTIGLHPHDAKHSLNKIEDLIIETVSDSKSKLVAIGECGLDYHYNHSERDEQISAFKGQIELAKKYNLSLIIHTREAWGDTFKILDDLSAPENTIIHCFTGTTVELNECLKRNYIVSFSGIVTFKKSIEVQEAAKLCPMENMIIETDSPFLSPEPYRGKPNSPKLIVEVAKKIAVLKGINPAEVASQTYINTKAVFNLN